MGVDEKEFFREATLRICGSLEIETALYRCLLYLRDFIPAVRLSYHLYNIEAEVVETVAYANPSSSVALSVRTPMPGPLIRRLQAESVLPRVRVAPRLDQDELAGPVAQALGLPDSSGLLMDLALEGESLGLLALTHDGEIHYTDEQVRLLGLLNEPFAIALTNALRYRELKEIRDRLVDDCQYLYDELRRLAGEEIIGADYGLKGVMELIHHVAPLDSPVLLLGETGVGKEVIATAIHRFSLRKAGPFIKVNCGAIPETLIDSELFGHEKGSFTGALARKRGRFERAHGGTIFLDEVGELPLDAQVRLLRVLQEKEIERVGGSEPVPVNIRVIAATHRDLESMMAEERFREDLYFRLKVFPVVIPPLRDRLADLPALAHHFMQKKRREMGLPGTPHLAPGALEKLMSYHWPGNVRELENAVERSLILCRGGSLNFADLAIRDQPRRGLAAAPPGESLLLDDLNFAHISRVLEMTGGRVEGDRGAARVLGLHPSTLRKRMKKLGLPYGRRTRSGPAY